MTMQRKINMLLVLFSLIGGAIGFAVGELLLRHLPGELPVIVIIGLYFGILALSIGLFCLLAEIIAPRLNGMSWRQRYTGFSWKLLIPATLVMLFILGLALEFAYQLNLGGLKPVKDIVLVIDNSGSMRETDPNQDRYDAAKRLIRKMDSDKRVAVMIFNDNVNLLQPFVQLKDDAAKDAVFAKIDALEPTEGGTNIGLSLAESMKHIQESRTAGRGTMVILLSDGFSELDTGTALAEYQKNSIAVNTIGLSLVDAKGSVLLKQIAELTGGQYYDVSKADDLSFVFQKIYDNLGERTLLTERTGPMQDNVYYMILRMAALVCVGTAIGLSLGLLFDNRYLARSFGFGGAVAGLMAGILLELGLSGQSFTDGIIRLLADLVLAGVISLFSWIIPIKENNRLREDRHRSGRPGTTSGFPERSKDSTSKGF